jgi:acyl-CoA thioesterase-1
MRESKEWVGQGRRRAAARLLLPLLVACGGGEPAADAAESTGGTSPAAAAPVAAAPGTSGASGARPADGVQRVVFVGTSLTAGLGLDPDSAYPALVARKADSAGVRIAVTNAGVSGETSAGALRRIDWVLREPTDVVVLETGANDGLRGLRVDSTQANIAAIVERIRAVQPTARVLLVQMEAPPNFGAAYTSAFRAMFPAVAERYGVTLAPFLLDRVAGVTALNQPDGVHPNEEGARIVAENVWQALRPVVAGR